MASIIRRSFVSPAADASSNVFEPKTYSLSSQMLNNVTWWQLAVTFFLGLVVYDQLSYVWQKGAIVGPPMKIPFMGPFLDSIYPKFSNYKRQWASGELSCVSVFHKFVVIASTRDMARKVLNSPAFVKPCVVDIAEKLLRPQNWVFLDGRAHVDYRKGLNVLFTRHALERYLPEQEAVYDDYFARMVRRSAAAGGAATPFMPLFREFMCAVALRVFVGRYLPESGVRKISDDYYKVTAAMDLVNFPYIVPFTRAWYGKKAADLVLAEFAQCAAMSKVKMATGAEAGCILDFWVQTIQASEKYRRAEAAGIANPEDKPTQLLRDFSDFEIAMTLFTFLFASQDATSSACTWLFQLLADRPEVLAKVRAENLAVRDGDPHTRLTLDMVDRLPYTRAVVKETLRYRPPVIMIPYQAKRAFPLTDGYTAPKGSMVVPCVYPALHDPEAYPRPDYWDPERWISGNAEAQTKNWLVFGTGPHYCLGQTYAITNLIALVGKASLLLDWRHEVTDLSEEVKVFATIFPMDDCRLSFSKRE